MRVFTDKHNHDIVRLLKAGGVGVLRTDTLYGIVALASDEQAVDRVYRLKSRTETKSPIVLIASVEQLFDKPDEQTKQLISEHWPGKVSIIMPSQHAPTWIKRENASVAYRLPDDKYLRELLLSTGPLIAPSANPEGQAPAMSVQEAIGYFGDTVDFYVDGGHVMNDAPSRLIRINVNGEMERLR